MAAYRIVKLDDSWKGRTRQFRYLELIPIWMSRL